MGDLMKYIGQKLEMESKRGRHLLIVTGIGSTGNLLGSLWEADHEWNKTRFVKARSLTRAEVAELEVPVKSSPTPVAENIGNVVAFSV